MMKLGEGSLVRLLHPTQDPFSFKVNSGEGDCKPAV